MNDFEQTAPAGEPSLQQRIEALLNETRSLAGQAQQVREENRTLLQQLAAARFNRELERDGRRAAVNLMNDVAEARRAEQHEIVERRRVEYELIEADRHKDEFLAILAHELRNPLAPISSGLHLLRMASNDHQLAEQLHDMLERQVSHLVRLVDDLMNVSRITRGIIELQTEVVQLDTIVRAALEESQPLFDAAKHQVTVDLPPLAIELEADSLRLTQALTNLLNNAARYTGPGGRIDVVVRQSGALAVISVRDNGIGILQQKLPLIFQPFVQLNRKPGHSLAGLGIGLTLVRSIVEAHGGTIEAHSEGLGRGSEFTICLPAPREQRPDGPPSTDRAPATQRTPAAPISARKILVVDDNQDAANGLAMFLKHLGAEVWTAYDGPTALELLNTNCPSVALLDIGMPGMDGNEVARRARQLPAGRETTLIAITGWGQEQDRAQTRQAGFDHHLVKPVDLLTLQRLLGELPSNATS